MPTAEYLTLRLIRLKALEQWTSQGPGLTFLFPHDGAGQFLSTCGSYRIGRGDVLVVNSSAGGSLRASSGGEMVFWSFSLCFEHLFPLFFSEEISLLQDVGDRLKEPKHYPASAALAAECHRLVEAVPAQFNLDHRSQLLRVVAAILSAEFKIARGQRAGFVQIEAHMIQVFESLSSSDLLNLSVGELAHKFGCSRRHLNRLFHQHFGFSVIGIRMEMRLLKAISLLRDPNAKIISVAEDCGFNHLGLFNTCFKKRFACSPGEWRKNALRSGDQSESRSEADLASAPSKKSVDGRSRLDRFFSEPKIADFPPSADQKESKASVRSERRKFSVSFSRKT